MTARLKLALACNWDDALVEVACAHGVTELFGKLHRDITGGGRASFISRRVSRRRAARYVRRAQEAGLTFNYLLNGTCMGNVELTRAGQRELDGLLSWLYDDCGVRWFTVSIPWLAARIKGRFPDAHLVVSMMARVESVEQARYWQEQGAEALILFDNKDFTLIRALKEQTSLELEIAANLSCLNRCHQVGYHGNVVSHSSNTAGHGLYTLPLCEARCTLMKVQQPRRILAGQWVRPEDLALYEAHGVDRLKLLDRTSSTARLTRVLQAYSQRRSPADLAELIPGYVRERMSSYFSPARLLTIAGAFFRPGKYNVAAAPAFLRRSRPPAFSIDAAALDGYLQGVAARDCRLLSCEACGFCDQYAREAIRFAPGERRRVLRDGGRNLQSLESGRFFRYRR